MTVETNNANRQSADQLIYTAKVKPPDGPHNISLLYFGGTMPRAADCTSTRRKKCLAQTAAIDIIDASEQHHDTTILNPKMTKKLVQENCPPQKRCLVRRVLLFLSEKSRRFSKIRTSLGSLRNNEIFRSSQFENSLRT